MLNETDLIEQFRRAMAEQGIVIRGEIIPDSKFHRFHVDGDRRGSRNGWLVLHTDGQPAGAFGCNKRYGNDAKFTWTAKATKPLTHDERREFRLRMDRQRAERAAEAKRLHESAARHARHMWDQAAPCNAHPYLTRKDVKSHGLRVGNWEKTDHENGEVRVISTQALLIPIRDTKKNIHSMQAIFDGKVYGDRDKDYLKDGAKEGNFYSIGKPLVIEHEGRQRAVIMIGEGYATVATAHEATGHAGIVAFDAPNILPVAKVLRASFPDALLVFLADNDQWTEKPVKNAGLTRAREAAATVGGVVAVPPFPADADGHPTDFNDLLALRGADAVRATINAALTYEQSLSPDLPINEKKSKADDDSDAPFASELALAESFTARSNGVFRWTPGMDWMVNCGTHWRRDEHLKRYSVAKAVCRGTSAGLDKPSLAAKICSAATSNAMLSLARSESSIVTPVDEWDKHPMILNTTGEAFDLETGRPVSRSGLLFTQVAGTAPVAMPTPCWDQFVTEIFGGDLEMVEFIQRMGGYTLTGSTKEQKLFFLHGEGANGKSVFLEVLRHVGGSYSHHLPSEALMTSKNERHPTTFAALQGKRIAVSSEIEESSHWAESRIKSLTGDATMTARYMRGDEFTFAITHKHLLAGNFKPRLKGDDFAMVRRMVLIPFMQRFEGARRDDSLPAKLKAEYPGILAWFIEGARKWAAGGLAIPEAVVESSKEYLAEQDDIGLWVSECCIVGAGLRCASADLYASFADWKRRNGEHAPSAKSFSQRLERTFSKKRLTKGVEFYGIKADAPLDDFGMNDYGKRSRGY